MTLYSIGLQMLVAGCMAVKLKPHQWEGIRFLWKNIVLEYEASRALSA